MGINPDLKFAKNWTSGRAGAPQSDPANEEGLPSIEERKSNSGEMVYQTYQLKEKLWKLIFFDVFQGDEENQTSLEIISILANRL